MPSLKLGKSKSSETKEESVSSESKMEMTRKSGQDNNNPTDLQLPPPRLLLPTNDCSGYNGFPSDYVDDQRSLTSASAIYDRNGKGYLDSAERALRNLDTQNKGYLDMDKIYFIMETLQKEQSKTSALVDLIRQEQRKTMNLKKVVVALFVFSVLLALANVGTSFAAAKLAQDTSVQITTNDLLSHGSGERVGTTSKYVSIPMNPLDAETRRRLASTVNDLEMTDSSSMQQQQQRHRQTLEERLLQSICTSATTENGSTSRTCEIVGTISYADAIQIYWSFCPNWPQQPVCRGGGVD
jgi:hypothetical protein